MSATDHSKRALLDGALPLIALLSVALLLGKVATFAVVGLYLVFAAGIATGGADRPGEPLSAWRLYALSMGVLAVSVPFGGVFVVPGLSLFAAGFAAHIQAKGDHGVRRLGLLSAFGRRAHDARVGRALELAALALATATVLALPALYAVAGWLVTAAAVAERETTAQTLPQPATSIVT